MAEKCSLCEIPIKINVYRFLIVFLGHILGILSINYEFHRNFSIQFCSSKTLEMAFINFLVAFSLRALDCVCITTDINKVI